MVHSQFKKIRIEFIHMNTEVFKENAEVSIVKFNLTVASSKRKNCVKMNWRGVRLNACMEWRGLAA
ncbi:hypothetical protein KGM_214157 [Danaus plexippus plexippus]|uniref:Uncharacterized protein n=1 Tax=Danaus plexippus plexippus TaxID=278856 RepID=A0A212FG15_DANPL|nr:hypothetical protein KGM_214157 [Danaus plexippus plexippus]